MELFRLFGTIFLKDDDVDKKLDGIDKKAGGLGDKLGGMVGTAAKWGAGMAAGAGVAVAGMSALASKAIETTSQITKFSQVTGFSTGEFQKWDYAMKTVGFSMEAASGDLAALAEKALDATSGVGENAETFKRLGVNVLDVNGKLKSQEQLFGEVITGLQGMENATERNAIATMFLSTTGEELAPILNMTSEELDNLKNKSNVISDEQLNKAAEFKNQWDQVTSTFGSLSTEIGVSVMPVLSTLLNFVLTNMPTIQLVMSTLFSVLGIGIDLLGQSINFLVTNVFNPFKDTIIANQAEILAAWEVFKTSTKILFDTILLLAKTIFGVLKAFWKTWGDEVIAIFKITFDLIVNSFKGVTKILTGLMNILIGVLTGDWSKAWNGMKDVVLGVWNIITGTVKAGINVILNGVNAIISALNAIDFKVPEWVPGIGGKSVGFNIPKVKMFAEGTDYFTGGYAIVGEEGPELVKLGRGSSVTPADETRSALGGLSISIDKFINNRAQDVENFAAELEFYRKQAAFAKGGA